MNRKILMHGFVNFAFAMLILSAEGVLLESIGLIGLAINFISMNKMGSELAFRNHQCKNETTDKESEKIC